MSYFCSVCSVRCYNKFLLWTYIRRNTNIEQWVSSLSTFKLMIHSTSEKIIMRLRQPNFSRHIQGTQHKYSQLPKKRVWKRPGENQELWKVFFNLARCLYGADVAKLLMPKNELKKMLEAAMLRLKNFLIFESYKKHF